MKTTFGRIFLFDWNDIWHPTLHRQGAVERSVDLPRFERRPQTFGQKESVVETSVLLRMRLHEVEVPVRFQSPDVAAAVAARKRRLRRVVGRRVDVKVGVVLWVVVGEVALELRHAFAAQLAVDWPVGGPGRFSVTTPQVPCQGQNEGHRDQCATYESLFKKLASIINITSLPFIQYWREGGYQGR